LDAHLELSSFKLENASHPVHLSRTDEGILSFLFSNINLPDSTSSFSESQGWINYTINHDPNIADSTLIENTAYIYFDQNAPIKTNTTQNLIVDEILSFESIDSEEISIYPNPSVQEIRIKGMSAQELMRIKILDINGRLLSDSNPNSLVIDVSTLSKGIYFIEVHSRNSKSILKFIKI